MILKSKGQTAYDATQEHRHCCGDGGDCGYGGKVVKDDLCGEGNLSLLLSDEEEDRKIWMPGFSVETGRQGMSEDSGSGGKEEPGRPGDSRAGKYWGR